MPQEDHTKTVGNIYALLQAYDPPKDAPLVALVGNDHSPTGESEVSVTHIRLEMSSDGDARMIFDTAPL